MMEKADVDVEDKKGVKLDVVTEVTSGRGIGQEDTEVRLGK